MKILDRIKKHLGIKIRRPRVKCPICHREVSVTKVGVTSRHRAGTSYAHRDPYHAVRLSDGKEV